MEDIDIKEIIKKLGEKQFDGSNVKIGNSYHSFAGYEGVSDTGDVAPRVKLITDNYDVMGKNGLDLGCSIGGVSIELARKGAVVCGVDHDYQSTNVAKAYADKEMFDVIFSTQKIDLDFIKKVVKPMLKDYDFCVFFSAWMWLLKQYGIEDALDMLFCLGKSIPVLFFETSLGEGHAGDAMRENGIDEAKMVSILKHCYKSVKKIGIHENWRNRPIFMCEGCLPFEYVENRVERIGYNKVRKMLTIENGEKELNSLIALTLEDSNHIPKLYEANKGEVFMEYGGELLEKLPQDWEAQAEEILSELKQANTVHRDIIPRNLLVKDDIIKLVDFEWSGPFDEDTKEYPVDLGAEFKNPSGFDDRYSLYKSLEWINTNVCI